SSRRRHTRFSRHWSSDVCSSDLRRGGRVPDGRVREGQDLYGRFAGVGAAHPARGGGGRALAEDGRGEGSEEGPRRISAEMLVSMRAWGYTYAQIEAEA